jgi:sulfhydrogenase subunit beta (sulfur reductase)
MGTGPECASGFDLVMTEIDAGYVMRSGSDRGEEVLAKLITAPASSEQVEDANREKQNVSSQITKHFDTDGVHDLLLEHLDHPHWHAVAQRCLSCTNCTMVCPRSIVRWPLSKLEQ